MVIPLGGHKTHTRETLANAVALLAERGALEAGELEAELYPDYEANCSTKRTVWNSLDSHFGEFPSVSNPEYGTWAADVEALLETEARLETAARTSPREAVTRGVRTPRPPRGRAKTRHGVV